MSTLDLKQEIHTFIDNSDDGLIKDFYAKIKGFTSKKSSSEMIEESEIDIKNNNINSQKDVQKMIGN